jgi:hypothetical protein
MIIVKVINPRWVKVGDVITYKAIKDILFTHRIIDNEDRNEQLFFNPKVMLAMSKMEH